jgi:exopolysaccharide biosynthesis polyprenyl glycosylphosphotransferase
MASLGTKLPRPGADTAAMGLDTIPIKRNGPIARNVFSRRQWLFVAADLSSIASGALLVIAFRFPSSVTYRHSYVAEHIGIAILQAVLTILFAHTQRLYSAYQSFSRTKEFLAILKSILLATILLGGCLFISGAKMSSRLVIAATALFALISMFGWREFRRRSIRRAAADGLSCHNVLIVGTGNLALALAEHLTHHRQLGFVVLGHVGFRTVEAGPTILGDVDQLETLCRTHFVDEIIVCSNDRRTVMQVISDARQCEVGVRIIPDLYDGMAWGAHLDHLGDFPSMTVVQRSIPAISMKMKRSLDVLVAGFTLALLSPLLLLLAIIIKLDSKGSVLYVSHRVGKKGRIFPCYKFRTMVTGADRRKTELQHLNEREGALFKIAKDPRITRAGRIMRKYSIDELPQLWNVLRGDMSLVGPRPPLVDEVEQYQLEYMRRLEAAPGITGLWQVEARNNPSFDRYISLDLHYIETWSLALDLQILFRTIAVVIAGTGS